MPPTPLGEHPPKKPNPKPPELRKATYDKTSILGSKKHSEGRAASRESKKDKW